MGSFNRRLASLYPAVGKELEPGEQVIHETWGQFDRDFLKVLAVHDEGWLLLTDRRLIFAPISYAKMLTPLTWTGGPSVAPAMGLIKAMERRMKPLSIQPIAGARASLEAEFLQLPGLIVTTATGEEYEFGVQDVNRLLRFTKANTAARDALLDAIRRQLSDGR